MGCDIHGFWELKHKSGAWIAVKPVNGTRNYAWFGIIAGVRMFNVSYPLPHHERGIPKDASHAWLEYTKAPDEKEMQWLHSHTWLTLSEVQKCNEEFARERHFFDYDWSEPREPILKIDETLDQVWFCYSFTGPENGAIKWPEKVSDFIGCEELNDSNARIVIAFDS